MDSFTPTPENPTPTSENQTPDLLLDTEGDVILPKKRGQARLEYRNFKTDFFKISLAGFKGEEKTIQIQEKSTSIIYQLIEKDISIPIYEKEMEKYGKYSKLEHPNVLQLCYYTSVFREENHGNPFCRVSLLFENAESDLKKQLDDCKASSTYLSDDNMLSLIRNSLAAFAYLQENNTSHGNITLKHFFITKKNEFKVLPNYFQRAKINVFGKDKKKTPLNEKDAYYFSPEAYKQANSRAPFERVAIDPYKSDVFTLGMNLLEAATLKNLSKCYNLYDINERMLSDLIKEVKERYSEIVYLLISSMLFVDVESREDFVSIYKTLNETTVPSPDLALISRIDDNFDLSILNNPDYLPQDYVNEIEAKIQMKIKKVSNRAVEKYLSKGNLFNGELNSKGEPHGYGSVWWATGDRFEGKFENGVYNGEGMYFFANGMKHYGNFKNGEIAGLGVRYYADKGIYFGQWKGGKNHGTGMFIWPNGEKFLGVFKDDEIEGLGTLTWLSGRKIEAIWADKGTGIGLAQTPEFDITLPPMATNRTNS